MSTQSELLAEATRLTIEEERNQRRLSAWQHRFLESEGRLPDSSSALRSVEFQVIVRRKQHLKLIRQARETVSNVVFLKKHQGITFGHFPDPEAS